MKKLVVNNYALSILVLRSQHLLKVLTSIASRSLTVTDPQPNKILFDKPTKKKPTKPNQPNPGSMLLMTMSTAVITVLHSAEVVHITHES
jgi:hypothetical protein